MPLSKLGNIRNDDISREILVAVHSEGKEARKLEALSIPGREFRGKLLLITNFSGSLDMGDRILRDFTLAGGQYITV